MKRKTIKCGANHAKATVASGRMQSSMLSALSVRGGDIHMNEPIGVSAWIHPPVKGRDKWLVEITTKEGVGTKEFNSSVQAFKFLEQAAEQLVARLGPMKVELFSNKER
jgi:hypothetical protein